MVGGSRDLAPQAPPPGVGFAGAPARPAPQRYTQWFCLGSTHAPGLTLLCKGIDSDTYS